MATLLGAGKRRTLVVVIAAIVLLGSLASVVLRVVRERAWQAQAQSEQTAQAKMYGPDGRDIRRPMKSLDEMYGYVGVRVQEEVEDSRYQHLPAQEKIRRNDALFRAMGDEIKRVTDSHYTKAFDRSAIESEYRRILWVDRMRADGAALAPALLIVFFSGAVAVGVVRHHPRQKAGT